MNTGGIPFSQSISKCLIIIHRDKPGAYDLSLQAGDYLRSLGLDVDTIPYSALSPGNYSAYDFALLFGGDGMALTAGRALCLDCVPILVINLGVVGFMAAFDKTEWQCALNALLAGQLMLRRRRLVDFSFSDGETGLMALNEVLLASEARFKICSFQLDIEGDQSLGLVRADGLMVATPTGTTAYALGCGGPLVAPDVQALLVLAVNPYAMAYRPFLISGERPLKIRIPEVNRHKILVIRDGICVGSLSNGQELDIIFSSHYADFIHARSQSFYGTVQKKLGWNAGISYQETGSGIC